MDFKSLLNSLDQLSEATKETGKGRIHTSEPGGYGRKDDEDEEGNKVKSDAPKKGRGRPKKDADSSGEVKKYDFSAFGATGKDVKLPKYDKKKTTKHSLKEYLDQLDKALNEEGITVKPMQGASQIIGPDGKPMGTADMATANMIKAASEKGTLKLGSGDELAEMWGNPYPDDKIDAIHATSPNKPAGPQVSTPAKHNTYDRRAVSSHTSGSDKVAYDQLTGRDKVTEKDIGKHNNAITGFDALVRKLTPKYGVEAAKRIAGAQMKKIKEADIPPNDSLTGAGLGAGRSQGVFEGRADADKKKLPSMAHIKKMCQAGKTVAEICKMHPDCDQKKLKQMVADCKKTLDEASMPMTTVKGKSVPAFAADGKGKNDLKKKVKEGADHRLKSARHRGKSHALAKEGYNCKYEDMQEARAYHDGFKEGLDECYDMYPMRGVVGEEMPSTVPGMAMQADPMIGEMDKTEYMQQQARSTSGDTFKAFGQTFKDTEVLESPFAFEAWDKELNALLESKEEVAEGVTISSSTGQQGSPDSVSISATDSDANKVLSFIKQLGIGAFSNQGDSGSSYGNPEAQNGSSSHSGIEVMGDHDGMMSLMKKVSGHGGQGQDYEDEEDHQHEEESCNECGGMMEAGHSCGSKEMVDEVETEDQMEYEVAEAEEVVNNNDEAEEEESDAQRDSALATAAGANFAKVDEDEAEAEAEDDELEESYANSADDDFTTDSEFMTDTITGGLNKKKSTGQTTIPVIAGQNDRMGYNVSESLSDWKMLAGIK